MMPAVAPLKRVRREMDSLPLGDGIVFFFIPPFFTPSNAWQEENPLPGQEKKGLDQPISSRRLGKESEL
jgi:hypothetical protein